VINNKQDIIILKKNINIKKNYSMDLKLIHLIKSLLKNLYLKLLKKDINYLNLLKNKNNSVFIVILNHLNNIPL